jgi:prophage antirepressor-like protein
VSNQIFIKGFSLKLLNFNFEENSIRTILIDNEPFFVLKDVANALSLTNHKQVLSDLKNRIAKIGVDLKEVSQTYPLETKGGKQEFTLVSEVGLYEVIFVSKKEEAIKFRFWITSEVLPSIRKTGSYSLQKEETQNEKISLQKSLETVETGIKLLKSLSNLNPMEKIQLDNLHKTENGFSLLEKFGISFENHYFLPTEIGNMIGMSGAEINLILEKKGFQFKDENGVWKPTEKGFDLCLEIGNKFNQLKWRISTIL